MAMGLPPDPRKSGGPLLGKCDAREPTGDSVCRRAAANRTMTFACILNPRDVGWNFPTLRNSAPRMAPSPEWDLFPSRGKKGESASRVKSPVLRDTLDVYQGNVASNTDRAPRRSVRYDSSRTHSLDEPGAMDEPPGDEDPPPLPIGARPLSHGFFGDVSSS